MNNNSKPWQTLINANHTSKTVRIETNLMAVTKSASVSTNPLIVAAKTFVMPKRYSFDDNGGSYLGL